MAKGFWASAGNVVRPGTLFSIQNRLFVFFHMINLSNNPFLAGFLLEPLTK